jgi:hypothetical protein
MKKLLLVFLTSFFCISANAACDVKSLKGSYGMLVSGVVNNKSCAGVGTIFFDGKGTSKIKLVESCGEGQLYADNQSTIYAFANDCVVGATFGNGLDLTIVFDRNLKVGQIMAVGLNGGVGVGSAIKQ